MALTNLWVSSRQQLEDKHIQQIIAFAGDGKLRDGSIASEEFREFLLHIPADLLNQYVDQCLQGTFTEGGLALQDMVNQVGMRLGFSVTYGRYRSTSGHIGYDGLWHFPDGHDVIIEVKTTDAYRINLTKVAEYRHALIQNSTVTEQSSSILIVVGHDDTGDLEAQIRGSRYAWDMRLISVNALIRLMSVKQDVEDPHIVKQIYDILIPREYAKLDEIVDVIFSTAEDIKEEHLPDEPTEVDLGGKKFVPVSFHEACVLRVEKSIGSSLIRRTRSTFSSVDDSIALVCNVSKEHTRYEQRRFWFAFHPHQRDFLSNSQHCYVAFGCGSAETILLIPALEFIPWLDEMNITEKENRYYWHVHISYVGNEYVLHLKGGVEPVNLSRFILR